MQCRHVFEKLLKGEGKFLFLQKLTFIFIKLLCMMTVYTLQHHQDRRGESVVILWQVLISTPDVHIAIRDNAL